MYFKSNKKLFIFNIENKQNLDKLRNLISKANMVQSSVPIERPDPPVVGKVTHHTIELIWMHLKEKLPANQRFKFVLQESNKNKKEWGQVYAGYGFTKIVESLEPFTEYSYRLCVIGANNERSEYSPICTIKTTKEPLNGEALHKAIILDRKSDVERILDSVDGPRVVEIPDKFGNLPLQIAVNRNNLEMVELLLYKGVQVNAQNESGKTAIMLAAFSGKLNVLKELRSNGASYDIRDKSGCSVLHYAIDGGNLDCIQYLLMDGLDVNITDTMSRWTPLIRAASIGANKDVAELLIKYKADINILDKDNKNALMIAVINGNQPFVQCLVENGADLNITNEYGKTAYEMAVAMDRRRVVKYFDEYFEKQKG